MTNMGRSPTSIEYPAPDMASSISIPSKQPASPSEETMDTTMGGKKKKKGLFGGFFGGKKGKKDRNSNNGNFPSGESVRTKNSNMASPPSKSGGMIGKKSKKGVVVDDRSIWMYGVYLLW